MVIGLKQVRVSSGNLQPWTKIMAKRQTNGDFLDTTSNATLFLETIWSA